MIGSASVMELSLFAGRARAARIRGAYGNRRETVEDGGATGKRAKRTHPSVSCNA